MDQLNFENLKHRDSAPKHITKDQLWDMLKTQQAQIEAQQNPIQEEMTMFSAKVPKTVATQFRQCAHLQGRKIQDATTEALRLWIKAHDD